MTICRGAEVCRCAIGEQNHDLGRSNATFNNVECLNTTSDDRQCIYRSLPDAGIRV